MTPTPSRLTQDDNKRVVPLSEYRRRYIDKPSSLLRLPDDVYGGLSGQTQDLAALATDLHNVLSDLRHAKLFDEGDVATARTEMASHLATSLETLLEAYDMIPAVRSRLGQHRTETGDLRYAPKPEHLKLK